MAAEWVARLTALGLNLPEVAVPVAAYVPAVAHGDVIYVSGQLPSVRGRVEYTGRLGAERTIEEGYAAARLCALNALAAAASKMRVRRLAPRFRCGVDGAPVESLCAG